MRISVAAAAPFLFALALAAGLIAPAQAQGRDTPTYDTALSIRAKKLGVLVTSGYRAHVVKRGTMMNFGKLGHFVPYDGAKVADAIFEAVVAQVSQEERYDISRVAIEPEPARVIAGKFADGPADTRIWEKLLAPYYEACHCDALLLVTDGRAENAFSETSPSFGPSFSAKAAVSNTGDAIKSHMRLGLLFVLVDPVARGAATGWGLSDVPDYSEEVAKFWPPSETAIDDAYWDRMAAYVGSPVKRYQQALFRAGLRPSCALPYYEKSATAQRRGEEPPKTLPGTDPAKCQPAP